MKSDWTYQWQHDANEREKKQPKKPRYADGDVVLWDGENVTINGVGRVANMQTFVYDIKEKPWAFVYEYELEDLPKDTVSDEEIR